MKETDKRKVTAFIPYRRARDGYEFYMQKRTTDAPTTAGLFNFFGGGIEGDETPEQGFFREVMEELVYTPKEHILLSKYETARRVSWVFGEEVGGDFESKVSVQEGEYGKFRSWAQIENSPDTALFAQFVIRDICKYFLKK
jgi:8-oxo-dGTP pyrophosphatase MutT (NUDIX family)